MLNICKSSENSYLTSYDTKKYKILDMLLPVLSIKVFPNFKNVIKYRKEKK